MFDHLFKKNRISLNILLFIILFFAAACSNGSGGSGKIPVRPGEILLPGHPEKDVLENDSARIDVSNLKEGYFAACYFGSAEKAKLQLTGPDGITYTYDMPMDGSWDFFPFTAGSGAYTLTVYEGMSDSDDLYYTSLAEELEVDLRNELLPFLYPNQFVNYDQNTKAVAEAERITDGCDTQADMVKAVFDFATTQIEYDAEKAATVTSGYLPDVDETLASRKGICFDYAALMTCMLRSRGIPTKLQIGFSGDIKHAWISTYLEDTGWAENIIQYDGTGWAMMDPTFAAEMDDSQAAAYIGDGTNYTLQYSR